MGDAAAAVGALAQGVAVGGIAEAAGYIEFGIDGEQQWQAGWGAGVDVFLAAGMPPAAAQAGVALALRAQRDGGRVVQEAAEGALAEVLIVAGVENEIVPEVIGDLGWHGDVFEAALEIAEKELPQGMADQLAVLEGELRMLLPQLFEQADGEGEGTDVFGPRGLLPAPP